MHESGTRYCVLKRNKKGRKGVTGRKGINGSPENNSRALKFKRKIGSERP